MHRPVLMGGLVAVAAAMLPLPALAGGPVATTCSASPIATPADRTPVGPGPCPGVRPGGRVLTSIGDCTLNFLFRAPDGTRYIGTAGHCVDPGPASNSDSDPDGNGRLERVWSWGSGPVAKDPDGHRIGEFAYAVLQDPKDFALIRLDPGVESNPEMCDFGGPTGINDDISGEPTVLQYFGNGIGIGTALPARSAVAMGLPNADHVYAAGLALPGDSGSAVISEDGRAVGVLVTVGIHGFGVDQNGVDFGTVGITRIVPQINRAGEALGTKFTMVTAKK